ncbi:hypothetical protein HK098_000677 [Nowakowskiella sp. JEL0407]|nr:hypothetical protein HK098_000677 [Nowakowskiella sp. JEL0407]
MAGFLEIVLESPVVKIKVSSPTQDSVDLDSETPDNSIALTPEESQRLHAFLEQHKIVTGSVRLTSDGVKSDDVNLLDNLNFQYSADAGVRRSSRLMNRGFVGSLKDPYDFPGDENDKEFFEDDSYGNAKKRRKGKAKDKTKEENEIKATVVDGIPVEFLEEDALAQKIVEENKSNGKETENDPRQQILHYINGVPIRPDLIGKLLDPAEWLSDEHLNAYLSLLQKSYPRCKFLSTFFWTKLEKLLKKDPPKSAGKGVKRGRKSNRSKKKGAKKPMTQQERLKAARENCMDPNDPELSVFGVELPVGAEEESTEENADSDLEIVSITKKDVKTTENELTFRVISEWTRDQFGKLGVIGYDRVVIPLHYANSHWSIAIIDLEQQELYFYDSMAGHTQFGRKVLKSLKKYLYAEQDSKRKEEVTPELHDLTNEELEFLDISVKPDHSVNFDDWNVTTSVKGTPRQADSASCGVFVAMFALCIGKGSRIEDMKVSEADALMFRRRMAYELAFFDEKGSSEVEVKKNGDLSSSPVASTSIESQAKESVYVLAD